MDGYYVYFDKHLILWGFKKQPTIARSFMEVEYKSVANTLVAFVVVVVFT